LPVVHVLVTSPQLYANTRRILERKTNPHEDGLLTGKVVHLALPVRWSLVGQEGRGSAEMACTYDIHPRGARLLSARKVNLGDLVMVERGRNKAIVRWFGPATLHRRCAVSSRCSVSKAERRG